MSKHRIPRVKTLRWSALVGAFALLMGGLTLALTTSVAQAHCHPWPSCEAPTTSSTSTTTSTTTTSTTASVATTTTTAAGGGWTGGGTWGGGGPQTKPPASTHNPNQIGTRPPGVTRTGQPKAPPSQPRSAQTPSDPDSPQAPGAVGAVPPGGGGGGTGGGIVTVPTAEVAEPGPASVNAPDQGAAPADPYPADPNRAGTSVNKVAADTTPVAATCLLGSDSAGGCSGADVARDLAPAGLLILGALALLGSGSFLESLRGSLRG